MYMYDYRRYEWLHSAVPVQLHGIQRVYQRIWNQYSAVCYSQWNPNQLLLSTGLVSLSIYLGNVFLQFNSSGFYFIKLIS